MYTLGQQLPVFQSELELGPREPSVHRMGLSHTRGLRCHSIVRVKNSLFLQRSPFSEVRQSAKECIGLVYIYLTLGICANALPAIYKGKCSSDSHNCKD